MSVLLSPEQEKAEERYEVIEHASGACAALHLILVRRPSHYLNFLIYQSVTRALGILSMVHRFHVVSHGR